MNKKGQTLIIFVILIPIILFMMAIVVDVGILTHEFQKTRGIIDNGIELYFENHDKKEIEKILKLNDIPDYNLRITEEEQKVVVEITYKIDALFGKIIHLDQYDISIKRVGKWENNQVIISKKE